MVKDKKKLARVIATWVVTSVMLSVFILDIVVVALGNKYVNEISVTDENFDYKNGDDRIHFLNTANSDCIIIESNGKFALIDSGEGNENPRRKTEYKGYRDEVINYIKKVAADKNGNVNFEFVLGTHMHYDHSGNFEAIFKDEQISANKAYFKEFNEKVATELEANDWGNRETYEKILTVLEDRKIPVISDLPDAEFAFGDFTIRFINTQTPRELYGNGENASSVGVIVKKGEKSAFLAADFTKDSGLEQVYADDIGDIDLLKIGHHGYYGSSSIGFLKKLKPEIAIVTNHLGKIYPNVKWNLTMVAEVPVFSTAHRNGIIATFTDKNEIILTQNTMER
ncbi:MAG: ComEC/Rec2 family competence protein [Acutalibacteraceae bacterium]